MSDMTDGRVKLVKITPRLVLEMLQGKIKCVPNWVNLPFDADEIASYYDLATDTFILKIYHGSFGRVQHGCRIPEAEPLQFEAVP